jgi:integrase
MKVWDAKQLARFMGATDGDRLFALWRLAAYTGMRRSELLGLRWEDIEFRHTHATLLLKQGQPVKVVLERLGHASPATMAVYQHVIPGMQAEAARAFAALIDGDE